MSSPPEKWAAARVWAAHRFPYLANALLAMDPVVVTGFPGKLGRFPADVGWHVYIEVAELERQSVAEVGSWLVHQVSHLLREHARRYPGEAVGREQLDWNLAADAELRDALGLDSLPGKVTPEQPSPPDATTPGRPDHANGGTAEQYWRALRTRPPTEHPEPPNGDCGSGCDGIPRAWECGRPGLSATGARLTALDTARRIRERLNASDDVPAGWLRWADDVLKTRVNWRRHLAARVRHGLAQAAGQVDYTYSRPSRRAAALPGIVLPSPHRPLPAVTILIDTSGSITETMLGQALAEVTGVLRAVGAGRRLVKVISCDARAYRPQTLSLVSELRLGGGGGTDLRAGFAAALAACPPPDLIIVLTDGRTPWPDRPPRTRVIVGLLDATGQAPSWAETVLIDSGA
ncbi:DUF2201 family putative metallopeptidase [Nonomuraea insulae]|uniref:VWA-like domain-containing protein n=1 Tax=Nonomuraea insulae TaxID=1616787 RepID=A0ABW1CGY5_9ACTN